jgi:hypothetical protein
MTSHPPLKFMLIYEDRATGIRAKELSDRLAAMLAPECHVTNEAWNFALLHDPQLRIVAADDARDAQMVIISAQSTAPLPTHIKTWLEEWLPEREEGKAALVVVLGGQEQDKKAIHYALMQDDLKELAAIRERNFPGSHLSPAVPPNVIHLPASYLANRQLSPTG